VSDHTRAAAEGDDDRILGDGKLEKLADLFDSGRKYDTVWETIQNAATQSDPIRQTLTVGMVES
jgi:hypothetical protein